MNQWDKTYTLPNGLELKNRLVFAPISTLSSNAIGQLSQEEIAFYRMRSQLVGLIILGSANVSREGRAYQNNVSIAHDAVIPNLKKYNEQIKADGAKSIVQIYHGGVDTNDCHDLTIQAVIEDFGKAIRRAMKAGFDGVEIHGGNPFLIQTFLSPLTNQRQDFWGGSENRRFHLLEAILRLGLQIREEAGKPFAMGVRLAMREAGEGGLTLGKTARIVANLAEMGIDYVHFNHDKVVLKRADLKQLSDAAGGLPVIGNGGITNLSDLEDMLDSVPLISVARTLILNPNFPSDGLIPTAMKGLARKKLAIPHGLWKSMIDSEEWYLNR